MTADRRELKITEGVDSTHVNDAVRGAPVRYALTYVPKDESVEDYRQIGRGLLNQAEWEFDLGDLVQASEYAWRAVAEFLKGAASQRRLGMDTLPHLGQVAYRLSAETGNREISSLFDIVSGLHRNFTGGGYRSKEAVRQGIDKVHEYLYILEAIHPPETLAGIDAAVDSKSHT